MKVLFISRGPSPYRVSFFNELGKICDLTVLFELRPNEVNDRDLSWFNEDYDNFKAVYLKKIVRIKNDNFSVEVLKYLKKGLYDVIIIGMYSTPTQMLCIEYMKLMKIPYALSSDGGFIKEEFFLNRLIKKHFIKGANLYFSSSKGTSRYLQNYGANENICIYPFTTTKELDLPNTILDSNAKQILKKDLGMNPNHKIILGVGQFVPRKGFDILIKASKQLDEKVDIYIIGGKPTSEYLKLRGSKKNIFFIDFKSKYELSRYYEAADLFVLPTREDIWGLVINEAMGYGLPVITTDKCLAGLELIENDINGYIVEADNINELSNRINMIINNEKLCYKMSINNFEKIKYYTIEQMAIVHYKALLTLEGKNIELSK